MDPSRPPSVSSATNSVITPMSEVRLENGFFRFWFKLLFFFLVSRTHSLFFIHFFLSRVVVEHILKGEIPYCKECKGLVKPTITFFGEVLPERFSTLFQVVSYTLIPIFFISYNLFRECPYISITFHLSPRPLITIKHPQSPLLRTLKNATC